MTPEPNYRPVLEAYPECFRGRRVQYLDGAGGFSGACFWRIECEAGTMCLRRWPIEHPAVDQLEFIQAVLWHVHQVGFDIAPLPVETLRLAGYVRHAGHLWELSPWAPGRADYECNPHPLKLVAAMAALADFHVAAEDFPLPHDPAVMAPGLMRRLHQLDQLNEGGLGEMAAAVRPGLWPDLEPRAQRLLAGARRVADDVHESLHRASRLLVPIQPCIRDIWHDHVLFTGREVTGLVDFGAMQPDNVATDVARLLGSLAGDDTVQWQRGLEAYESIRPLAAEERELVLAYDRSGVLLSGLNWLRWIYVEERQFDHRETILRRLDGFVQRLDHLAGVN